MAKHDSTSRANPIFTCATEAEENQMLIESAEQLLLDLTCYCNIPSEGEHWAVGLQATLEKLNKENGRLTADLYKLSRRREAAASQAR